MKENRPIKLFSLVLTAIVLALLGGFALSCKAGEEAGERLTVMVSIAPQAEFVEKLGGERVDVHVMVPPGASPHTYEPTPSQIEALSKARIYTKVGSGVEFELAWMDKLAASNREMLIVDCSRGVELMEATGEESGGEHQGLKDPHIWLSPANAKIMLNNIYEGLARIDPGSKDYYERNRDAYLQELTELDREIRDRFSEVANRQFIVYHPAWAYFAREYGLSMLAIEEEGKEPTAADIAHIIDQAKQHQIRVIFASPQYNPQSAEVIARAIDGRVVFIDPSAQGYIDNLRAVSIEIAKAME